MPAKIVDVVKGGAGDTGGVRPGDTLISVNGEKPRDIIDYQILSDEALIELALDRLGKELEIKIVKEEGESLGLIFDSSLFDGLKQCRNKCVFCFVDQLPKGVRKSLRVKDDDYRLSFLYGNFITLTNMSVEEIERIVAQRISPLYVSLHATNPEVHRSMLRPAAGDSTFEHLKALLEGGIELHVQIVLCPDINDGGELRRTLRDLEQMEGVRSVGIVPVGLTDHREGLSSLRRFRKGEVRGIQSECFKKHGEPWVYLSDEFYLAHGFELPPAEDYADYPQLENGIGIARFFLDGIDEGLSEIERGLAGSGKARSSIASFRIAGQRLPGQRIAAVTGKLAAGCVGEACEKIARATGVRIEVLPVDNRFLGKDVTVAGLVAGADVERALKEDGGVDKALLPDVMLNDDGLFIDDKTIDEVARSSGVTIEVVPADGYGFIEWCVVWERESEWSADR